MKNIIERLKIKTDYGIISYLHRNGNYPLILIHGLGGVSNNFIYLFSRLNEKFEIIAPDMLGHGMSAKPEINYTIELQCKIINDIIDSLGLNNNIAIAGNSYGGWISLYYALHFKQPEYLILMDSVGIEFNGILENNIDKFLQRLNTVEPGNNLNIMRNIILNSNNCLIKPEELKNIKSKTIIIWGDNDNRINIKYAKIIKDNIKNSSIYIIKYGGHVPMINKPDNVAEIINKNIL